MEYSFFYGTMVHGMFWAMVVFAAIGVAVRLLWDATHRDQNSPKTPEKFSFRFLMKDNWKTILLSIITVLLTIRFIATLFPEKFSVEQLSTPQGKDLWLFGAVIIGFMYNSLFQVWKKKAQWLKGVKRSGSA